VLYDAYMSAADAILGIENQPRAQGVDLLEKENGYLIAKAWTVTEQLARLQPSADGREAFVQTLFDCAIENGPRGRRRELGSEGRHGRRHREVNSTEVDSPPVHAGGFSFHHSQSISGL
jgi:hypothetical protein